MKRNNNVDKQGRKYASVATTKVGDMLETDGGFTCMKEGVRRVVQGGKERANLYIKCRSSKHYLNGQLSDDATHYVGLYKVRRNGTR